MKTFAGAQEDRWVAVGPSLSWRRVGQSFQRNHDEEGSMVSLEKRSIDSPDETRSFRAHGHADVVTLGDFTIGRGTFEPGWKWSHDVKPIAGTDSCQVRHTGVFVSGRMTVRADDGTEVSYGAGDVFVMEPGHDAWVDGDEACIIFDTGIAPYAKPAE